MISNSAGHVLAGSDRFDIFAVLVRAAAPLWGCGT